MSMINFARLKGAGRAPEIGARQSDDPPFDGDCLSYTAVETSG